MTRRESASYLLHTLLTTELLTCVEAQPVETEVGARGERRAEPIDADARLYACMHVRMHACVRACMYASIHVRMHAEATDADAHVEAMEEEVSVQRGKPTLLLRLITSLLTYSR